MKPLTQTACICAVLTGLVLLATGCGKKPATNVLARVGDQTITVDDFKAELQYRQANHQPVPSRQALLEEMITHLTLVQQAKAAGLDNSPDVHRTFETILIAKLKETQLEPRLAAVKISPEEIQAAYQKDITHFTQPAKAKLAIVYLAADAKLSTNQLTEIAARAEEARQQALALPATEKSFGRVAAEFSDDQITRYRGGDAGWFNGDFLAERWPQEVLTAGMALPDIGDTSGLIHAADGFYFVKKMDARPSVVAPLAQVQGAIESRLLTAKRAQIEKEFAESLQAGKVQKDLPLLSQVAYPTQSTVNIASLPPSLPASP